MGRSRDQFLHGGLGPRAQYSQHPHGLGFLERISRRELFHRLREADVDRLLSVECGGRCNDRQCRGCLSAQGQILFGLVDVHQRRGGHGRVGAEDRQQADQFAAQRLGCGCSGKRAQRRVCRLGTEVLSPAKLARNSRGTAGPFPATWSEPSRPRGAVERVWVTPWQQRSALCSKDRSPGLSGRRGPLRRRPFPDAPGPGSLRYAGIRSDRGGARWLARAGRRQLVLGRNRFFSERLEFL